MRKTVALLLTAVLLLCAGSALSDRLETIPAQGHSIAANDFIGHFKVISEGIGCPFVWGDDPQTNDGTGVYYAWTEGMVNSSLDLTVYTTDGYVDYFTLSAFLATGMNGETDGAEELMNKMCKGFLVGTVAMYFSEYGTESGTTTDEAAAAALSTWNEMADALAEKLKRTQSVDPAAYATEVLGYPVGMTSCMDGSTMAFEIYFMNGNGLLWVE